jgi:hypothetical protein
MIGLLQMDGKWPNLALMHIGGYLRENEVEVQRIGYIEQEACFGVFASKVFPDSPVHYVRDDAVRGGTGWKDWKELLPLSDDMEHCYPAYDMWGIDYAMGFLTRGCSRDCGFCFVPAKEGLVRHHSHLSEWWRGQDKIRLMDNNLLANPDHLGYINELTQSKAMVSFTQGLDARFLTGEAALALAKVKLWGQIYFAWDNIADEQSTLIGLALAQQTLPKGKVAAFVLIGFNTTEEEDLYRVQTLRKMGIDPFAMPYNRSKKYQRRFARWVNHKAIFKSVSWKDYNAVDRQGASML